AWTGILELTRRGGAIAREAPAGGGPMRERGRPGAPGPALVRRAPLDAGAGAGGLERRLVGHAVSPGHRAPGTRAREAVTRECQSWVKREKRGNRRDRGRHCVWRVSSRPSSSAVRR